MQEKCNIKKYLQMGKYHKENDFLRVWVSTIEQILQQQNPWVQKCLNMNFLNAKYDKKLHEMSKCYKLNRFHEM